MKILNSQLKVKGSSVQQSSRAIEQQKDTTAKTFSSTAALLGYWATGLILLFTVSGCGYKFQRSESLPFDSVKIGRIENRTYEPKLEDKLHKALADELNKNGIMILKSSGNVISGYIEVFELKPLREKNGLAVEYEVIIKGNFFLTSPEGKVAELRNSGAFIVSFSSEGNLQGIMASKEMAIESALKNLSSEIRAGMIYERTGKTPAVTPEEGENTRY